MVSDRENVINLHMGIPKANGLRDDVQLMWSGSALNNYGYTSPSDIGPGINQFISSFYGTKYAAPTCGPETVGPGLTVNGCSSSGRSPRSCSPISSISSVSTVLSGPFPCPTYGFACGPTYLGYADAVTYNKTFGSVIATSPTNITPPTPYYAPNTPPHQFNGPVPLYDNSVNVNQNDTGITKLQYTYALSQSAYLRAYGYTFYSDWMLNDPTWGASGEEIPSFPEAAQYLLLTHTSGGALDFQDQLNDQNLITLDGNYSTATVTRLNNPRPTAVPRRSATWSKNGSGGFTCYGNQGNLSTGTFGYAVPCLSSSYYDVARRHDAEPHVDGRRNGRTDRLRRCRNAGGSAGATWDTLWNSQANGSYNTVKPVFTNASLQDQFRPSDKFLINAALRYDNFTYNLPDSANAANEFYANMTANYTCVLASTSQVFTRRWRRAKFRRQRLSTSTVTATRASPRSRTASVRRPAGSIPTARPKNGVAAPNFTAQSPSRIRSTTGSRVSRRPTRRIAGYRLIRASAGRYTQPPISASVQYLALAGDDRSVWNNTMNLGFYSPFHPIPGISSGQYDLSCEQHFKGTDMSFKLTPFYTWVSNWQQQTFIGAGFVTQVPVGVNRNEGVEFQFNKGDFSRNGLSGLLAFTYTNSKVMFQNVGLSTGGIVPNELGQLNQAIVAYNALTRSGGGSPCYQAGQGVACSTPNGKIASGYDTVLNPYYNLPPQGQLNESGWYNPYSTAIAPNLNGAVSSYISPCVSSLILNWRHDKLAITPSFSFQTGGYYGSPLDTKA